MELTSGVNSLSDSGRWCPGSPSPARLATRPTTDASHRVQGILQATLAARPAIQAPIILMSQNRQSEKDRISAEHDYEVNLKAELEIMLLHEKMDLLREKQWDELIQIQKQQLELLSSMTEKAQRSP